MKKLIIFCLLAIAFTSCIKKKALKYDPNLVGLWVSNSDSINTWLTITPDGQGDFMSSSNDESNESGEVNYSLFEKKMWVGKKKFKVTSWLSGKTDGVAFLSTKERGTLKDTTYFVDMKMILKTTGVFAARSIVFYRVKTN